MNAVNILDLCKKSSENTMASTTFYVSLSTHRDKFRLQYRDTRNQWKNLVFHGQHIKTYVMEFIVSIL